MPYAGAPLVQRRPQIFVNPLVGCKCTERSLNKGFVNRGKGGNLCQRICWPAAKPSGQPVGMLGSLCGMKQRVVHRARPVGDAEP